MGLLDGRTLLVTGVLTDSSIAFHVARLAQEEGADVVLTSFGRQMKITTAISRRLPRPAPIVELDVTSTENLDALAGAVREYSDTLHGVVHSELPEQEDGRMEGFQLWLNLAAKDKMRAPWYRDIQSADIPEFTTAEGVKVRAIAGRSHGVDGAMQRETTEPLYLDLELPAGASFAQALPPSHNAFVYVYRGALEIADTSVPAQRMAILANGGQLDNVADGVVLRASQPARALLIAGKPLGEPIAQYGPFVMNTNDEIFQAVKDFQSGQFAATA